MNDLEMNLDFRYDLGTTCKITLKFLRPIRPSKVTNDGRRPTLPPSAPRKILGKRHGLSWTSSTNERGAATSTSTDTSKDKAYPYPGRFYPFSEVSNVAVHPASTKSVQHPEQQCRRIRRRTDQIGSPQPSCAFLFRNSRYHIGIFENQLTAIHKNGSGPPSVPTNV